MSETIVWRPEAEVKLKEIPFFVRPFARRKIEAYAKDNSFPQITIEIYEDAKKMFNKKYE
jgi:Proto-chlorophyllide reductase 57 kD subunit